MSEPMKPGRLAEIDARLKAATPGPWRSWTDGRYADEFGRSACIETAWSYEGEGGDTELVTDLVKPADAEFIAHAPEDIAELRAEVDRLQRLVEGLERDYRKQESGHEG